MGAMILCGVDKGSGNWEFTIGCRDQHICCSPEARMGRWKWWVIGLEQKETEIERGEEV